MPHTFSKSIGVHSKAHLNNGCNVQSVLTLHVAKTFVLAVGNSELSYRNVQILLALYYS
jgi:hypothetical protein